MHQNLVTNLARILALLVLLSGACARMAEGIETVVATVDGETETLVGRALKRDSAGGMFLETIAGGRYVLPADQVQSRTSNSETFAPLTPEAMGEALLAEAPEGFRIHTTEHYVVCYDTSREYAEWTSSLLEGLYRAFTNYWSKAKLELSEPEFPLAVVIFRDVNDYAAAARSELGAGAANVVGFYSLKSNRVIMYDITGSDALRGARSDRRDIGRMLAQPAAAPLVATIVHEATHQVSFNCGLLKRYSNLPLWFAEGLAIYFEAPDPNGARGWRGIGKINHLRMATFRENLPQWNTARLASLLADDRRLRDPRSAIDAYADAWALTYYLIRYHRQEYTAYVKELASLEPLAEFTPDERIAMFQKHFGELEPLARDLVRTMSRLR